MGSEAESVLDEIGAPEVVFVAMAVADVRVDPGRTPGSSATVARLLESLPATSGLLSPIGVDSDGLLIYGHDRLEAHRLLGWDTISARVFPAGSLDDKQRQSLRWEENHTRSRPDLESEAALMRSAQPILRAQATAARRKNGVRLAADIWGQDRAEIAGGNFPPAISEPSTVAPLVEGGNFPLAIESTLLGPGKARDKLDAILTRSAKTVEKFNILVALSEDESLPEQTRQAIARERDAANSTDQVDGHLKRAKQLARGLSTTSQGGGVKVVDLRFKVVKIVTLAEESLSRLDHTILTAQGAGDALYREDIVAARQSAARIVGMLDAVLTGLVSA